jgi:hypothetical protein
LAALFLLIGVLEPATSIISTSSDSRSSKIREDVSSKLEQAEMVVDGLEERIERR